MSASVAGFLGSVTVVTVLTGAFLACWVAGHSLMPRPVEGGPRTHRSPRMQLRVSLQFLVVLLGISAAVAVKFMKTGSYGDYVRWELQILGPVAVFLAAFHFYLVRAKHPNQKRVSEVGMEKAYAERGLRLGRFLIGGVVVVGYVGYVWAGTAPWKAVHVGPYATFRGHGVTFQYPSNWNAKKLSGEGYETVSITAPTPEGELAPGVVVIVDRHGLTFGNAVHSIKNLMRARDVPVDHHRISVPGATRAVDWEVEEETTGPARVIFDSIYARTVVALGADGEVVRLAVVSPGKHLDSLRDDFDRIVGSLRLDAATAHTTG